MIPDKRFELVSFDRKFLSNFSVRINYKVPNNKLNHKVFLKYNVKAEQTYSQQSISANRLIIPTKKPQNTT